MSQQVSEDGGGAKEWYEQGSDILAAQNVNAQALFVGDAGGAAESPAIVRILPLQPSKPRTPLANTTAAESSPATAAVY